MKTGRNQLCPCGSGIKYKKCHEKTGIDFDKLSHEDWIKQLSVRGKNILFINRIGEALQLDSVDAQPKTILDFIKLIKKAMTPEAVRNIHLSITEIWPDGEDLERCMLEEKNNHSALFIGSYLFDVTTALLNKHALYDKCIILLDPIHDHRTMAPEYNPINKPEEHITTTFHYVILWLQLLPWIEKGIVKIIRDPGDFDYQLKKSTYEISRNRSDNSEILKSAMANQEIPKELDDYFNEQFSLSHPDEFWVDKISNNEISDSDVRKFLKEKRQNSLYYVDVGQQTQLLAWTSGTNYEMGKYICGITNSHIITDLSYRWKEMEYDRNTNGVHIDEWSPFSKAIQGSELKQLNGLTFQDLLKLRDDGYLEDMRAFLRRVWSSCSSGESFDNNNIENLSAELTEHINIADAEWRTIDSNLVKWFGSESIMGTAIGVSVATAGWIPAVALAAAGAVNLGSSTMARHRFMSRYPAAFFIQSIRKKA